MKLAIARIANASGRTLVAPWRFVFVRLQRLSKRFSRQNLYEWLEAELSRAPPSTSALNIGAGGEIEKHIRKHTEMSVVSIDVDPRRSPNLVMDACRMAFADDSFDMVLMMEVLEHVSTPQAALDEIYRVLKRSGTLILSTPFVFGIHDIPHDYYRYTSFGLRYLLRRFDRVSISRRNGYFHAVAVLPIRLVQCENTSDKFIGCLCLILAVLCYPIIWVLDKAVKSDSVTTGYFCTARKRTTGAGLEHETRLSMNRISRRSTIQGGHAAFDALAADSRCHRCRLDQAHDADLQLHRAGRHAVFRISEAQQPIARGAP